MGVLSSALNEGSEDEWRGEGAGVGDRKGFTETMREFERYLRTYPSRQGRLRKESTIEQYVYIVGRLAEYLARKGMKSFKEATAKDLEDFVLNYENRAPASKNGQIGWWMRNLVINTLRSFYKWLYRDEVGWLSSVRGQTQRTRRQAPSRPEVTSEDAPRPPNRSRGRRPPEGMRGCIKPARGQAESSPHSSHV
jgi:hypothetical protein